MLLVFPILPFNIAVQYPNNKEADKRALLETALPAVTSSALRKGRSHTIEPCPALLRLKMASRPRPASAVAWNLNGARSGPRTGPRLNTAAIGAGKINEKNYLYSI